MARRSDRHAEAPQLSLFGDEEKDSPIDRGTLREPVRPCAVADDVRALAKAVPSWLRLGTSSWTFPGWGPDLVYEREGLSMKHLADRGLEAYAQHPLLRTVGIDRTFYAPMRQDEWAAYRGQVPDDFVPIAKVWSGVTSAVTQEGARNEHFLSADRFLDTMWEPAIAGGFDERLPFVFEIPPMRREHEPPVAYLLERLERLLDAGPRAPMEGGQGRVSEASRGATHASAGGDLQRAKSGVCALRSRGTRAAGHARRARLGPRRTPRGRVTAGGVCHCEQQGRGQRAHHLPAHRRALRRAGG